MSGDNVIVNRVASSGIVTFDLEEYYRAGERVLLDIKDQLYQGLVLKEMDFRAYIKAHDWAQYKDKFVAITCSADAIVPTWAYMLLAIALKPYVKFCVFGTLERLEEKLFEDSLSSIEWSKFSGKKVVVKGCSKVEVPVSIYLEVAGHLQPIVSSLMYGEPCSTVPLYKAPREVRMAK